MKKLQLNLLILIQLFWLGGCVTNTSLLPNVKTEVIKFKSESRRLIQPVIAEISFPANTGRALPVIITQHGSSRDGKSFFNGAGRTDEYSTRLILEGTNRGFAVVAIDAFFKTALEPGDKRKFPNAFNYALDLRQILANDPRFDARNLFYTGFSYGAAQVMKSVGGKINYEEIPWRAVAASEPGCNVVSRPVKVPFPVLMIKGSDSHYYPEPCKFYGDMIKKTGTSIEIKMIEGANHFFSSNGQITKGIAVNGCRHNIVIRNNDGTANFADGRTANRASIIKRCLTTEAGSGKNRVFLDSVINDVLVFFKNNKAP